MKRGDAIEPQKELTGGKVNYYLAHVRHPQRETEAYQAECEDIIEALEMNFDEACIFKALWRSAAARQNRGKPGHTAVYDAEKILHYGNRILRRLKRTTDATIPTKTELREENAGILVPAIASAFPSSACFRQPKDGNKE